MRRLHESGFSTLEVIAAVAIIALALIPIAALQTQLARNQIRLSEKFSTSTDVRNAIALLRDINPMRSPQGQRRLDEITTLVWTSTPLSDIRPSTSPAGFDVRLYRVSGEIRDAGTSVTTVQIDVIGWRRTADPSME